MKITRFEKEKFRAIEVLAMMAELDELGGLYGVDREYNITYEYTNDMEFDLINQANSMLLRMDSMKLFEGLQARLLCLLVSSICIKIGKEEEDKFKLTDKVVSREYKVLNVKRNLRRLNYELRLEGREQLANMIDDESKKLRKYSDLEYLNKLSSMAKRTLDSTRKLRRY